ncbi:Glucan endo-1,3-alpha-glucosidase agn1 [Psilocybe cubensis]|uniref:Glucan endo-1,3-alpha-glucosidase agn1 n=2 Tax=Psilocybe cubensis TaxID=181762 RepID=A0ACB8GXW7_PSICU|nr:Glucan endo-1,3-alpha-glucosidase agn1 [Psilocybe cubensis]KAH9480429.1 Glucan endo-1,3-alpha-glucosidase agn1 [Psilocybe cubensis]
MYIRSFLLLFITVCYTVKASTIPIRRIRLPPNIERSSSENYELKRRHARAFAKRQDAINLFPTPTSSIVSSETPQPSESSTVDPTAQASQLPTDANSPRKYVVAHHMVGNTFPYTVQDWADDIALAHASGIDGFALNMGIDDWQPDRVSDAYTAAHQSNLDFKLFLSLDMSSFPCASPNDAQALRDLVNAHASHPNQLQIDSKAFVSTFAGEACNFGQGSTANGWKTQFTQHPDLQGKIHFVPSFFIDPATFKDFADVMDGDFNWNSGWPIQVTTSFAQSAEASHSASESASGSSGLLGIVTGAPISALTSSLESKLETAVASVLSKLQLALTKFIGATETDDQHLAGLAALSGALQARDGSSSKKTYMAAVSPWFFTHYGPDSFNKNFVFLSDQHLYSKRWDSLISQRDQFDVVQVITWNDYGESHYIGPIKGDQPNSQAWTNGMNHTAWLDLTQYYATAFKTGQYPTIEKDKIVMWSRPHSTNAQSSDPVPQPTNFEIFEDIVWAVVMTTAPSNVILSTSPTNSMTFEVPAGVSKLAIPITPGGTMKGVIQRDGQTVVELAPTADEFTFQGSPQTYNFNAFVASATAD